MADGITNSFTISGIPSHTSDERDRSPQHASKFPLSLALMPAGLEVVPANEHDKEVDQGEKELVQAEKEVVQAEKEVAGLGVLPDGWHVPWRGPKMSRTIWGLRVIVFWGMLISLLAIISLGVGLGVGLRVNLRSSQSSHNESNNSISAADRIGGSLNASYYSRQGAWNGSGIALASQSFPTSANDTSVDDSLVLYYQHHSGDIRWQRSRSGEAWVGGSRNEIVATDAKNSTPLSAVAYVRDGLSIWHLFYIDKSNNIRQRSSNNNTSVWTNGSIDKAGLKAYKADLVGMQTCWAEPYGMRIWFASDSTTFEEYKLYDGQDEWIWQRNWTDYNGAAGVGCYGWGEDNVTYAALVNPEDNVEFWFKREDDESIGGSAGWAQTNVVLPGVNPASSLSYINLFYVQMAETNRLQAYNISWNGNITDMVLNDTFSLPRTAIPGSHFAFTALPDSDGGGEINAFFQAEGNDITELTRDYDGGQWSEVDIRFPDD